jgi:hypothetical protein
VVDVDVSQMQQSQPMMHLLQQDRNQVGCYVHLNHRLQDVMVLSDRSYQVKIQITPKGLSDDDRIQITFKKLAGNEDEEPIGK